MELYAQGDRKLREFLRTIKQKLMVNEAQDLRHYLHFLVVSKRNSFIEVQRTLFFDN